MRALTISLSIFLAASLNAAIRIHPELPLADPNIGAAAGAQTSPQAASDGDGFLVAYANTLGTFSTVNAVRLDANGVVQDVTPLVVANHTDSYSAPAVAFGRDRYLVAWRDSQQIFARTITPSGLLGDTTLIANVATLGSPIRIAFDGTQFLIVWSDGASQVTTEFNTFIRGALVTPDGRIGKAPFDLARTNSGNALDVAAIAGRFLVMGGEVAWNTPPPIAPNGYPSRFFTVRVDDAGNVSERIDYDPATIVFDLQLASNGSSFLAAWATTSSLPGEIQTMRIDANGIADTRSTAATGTLTLDDVEWNGSEYAVLFDDGKATYAIGVRATGEPAGVANTIANPNDGTARDGALAANGRMTLAVLTTGNGEQLLLTSPGVGSNVVAELLDNSLAPRGAEIDVALSQPYRANPAVASNASGALAVWFEVGGDGVTTLVARPLTPDGQPIGIPVTIARRLQNAARPQLASDGTNYLVVWRNGLLRAIVAMRLAPDGQPLDAAPIVIATDPYYYDEPLVTFDGNVYVITYLAGLINLRGGPATSVYSASVSKEGTLLAAGVLVSAVAPPTNNNESIASLGDGRSLIVWQQSGSTLARFVRGATPDGGTIVVATSTSSARVAASGGRFVVAMLGHGLTFATVSDSGVVSKNYMPPLETGDATNVTLMPIDRGVLVIMWNGLTMAALVVDSDGNVIAQPFSLGNGSPGALPSSTTAPFVEWRQLQDYANVFTRQLEWLPAPPRIRVTRR
ncbi:MAG: hypothetical protein QOI24_2655 [Acidobacteriota bacterium]|jgi:hypothetical protein|nr:hypothetical protein [Acidobacteriota bacterium]